MIFHSYRGIRNSLYAPALIAATVFFGSTNAVAELTLEAPLDTPGIKISKRANDIAVAGTGLLAGSSTIDVHVPGYPKQVLVYWEGEVDRSKNSNLNSAGDDTIEINGHIVSGELISGPTHIVGKRTTSTYRADITHKRFVRRGRNSLHVSGLDDYTSSHGAGIAVLYKNYKRRSGQIDIREGGDFARSASPFTFTHEQVFTVKPSFNDRMAKISLFVSGIDDQLSGVSMTRTSAIDVTVGDETTTYDNFLLSVDGDQWDTLTLDIVIPAGEDTVAVQLASVNNLNVTPNRNSQPASFVWNFASLSVEKGYGVKNYRLYKKKSWLYDRFKRKIYNHHSIWHKHK